MVIRGEYMYDFYFQICSCEAYCFCNLVKPRYLCNLLLGKWVDILLCTIFYIMSVAIVVEQEYKVSPRTVVTSMVDTWIASGLMSLVFLLVPTS